MAVHLLGQGNSDANDPAGFLPGQVSRTAIQQVGNDKQGYVDGMMGLVERTLRKVATPAVHVKTDKKYRGTRTRLWKSRETGMVLYAWPERGFVHIERDDGQYKKWTVKDALDLAYGFGEQGKVTKWPDEKQNAFNACNILFEICKAAKNQGDPTIPTDEEKRALKESLACAMLPGYGPIPEQKISFVGSNIAQGAT